MTENNQRLKPKRLVILVSGGGSNLQSLIDGCEGSEINATISAVISNNPGAGGLERAAKAGIPNVAIDHKAFDSREAFDQALSELIDSFSPDLVILAGFMRILTAEFVDHYLGRMMNIHPSFYLPTQVFTRTSALLKQAIKKLVQPYILSLLN